MNGQALSGLLHSPHELRAYLAGESHLPGPRGNLELAGAFAALVEARVGAGDESVWPLCLALAAMSPAEAPTNDPGEFVAFCGVRGIGAAGAADPDLAPAALARLHDLAGDCRWRLREAVAQALQRLLASRREETLTALRAWVMEPAPLLWRAVAAGLADPPLLKESSLAMAALVLHETILANLGTLGDRRSDAFRSLRQGLGYSLSVVVAAVPADGFALMRRLALSVDRDMRWIVAENLKKGRLARPYPDQVATVRALLG